MTQHPYEKKIPKPWSPATYRIKVGGELDKTWSDRLGGMRITTRKRKDQTVVSTLSGRLADQGELSGVLNSLYEMHFPLLLVEKCSGPVKCQNLKNQEYTVQFTNEKK